MISSDPNLSRMEVIFPNSPHLICSGVNSFGFGGANAHVLLHWNEKAKIKAGCPNDNLPRLICVSSRSKEGINAILDDYQTRNCDCEFAYLIHQAFR